MDDTIKPNLKRERKAASRERILGEAASAIRLKGTALVSVHEVMRGAGMTVGGFYAHFGSKDDLLGQAITYMFDERYARFLQSVATPAPEETLSRFVDTYLSMRHRDAVGRGCPIPALAGEIGRLSAPVRARFVDGMDRLTGAVEALLTRLGHEDSAAVADSAIAEMTGAIGLARVQPDPERAEALLEASRQRVRKRLGLAEIGRA